MRLTTLKAVGIAAGVAALAFIGTPASAGSTLITDGSGLDFDAACLIGHPLAPVGSGNNVPSPGSNPNCLIGVNDGSSESTDFSTVGLSSVGSDLVAEFTVDGNIPAAGSTTPPALGAADLPANIFVGFGYKAMFQNQDGQTNTPYIAGTRLTGTPIFGLNEHWADGFHHFVGFDAVWDGNNWLHSAQIGTYDPSPEGGFFFDELGVSNSPGVWTDDDPACTTQASGDYSVTYGPGNKVTVKVKGEVQVSSPQAVGGCVTVRYGVTGNRIINVKGWATADATVTLPITIPLSLIPGFGDLTSVGGFIFSSDMTAGNSINNGIGATLATLVGDNVGTACTNEGLLGIRPCVSSTGGLIGLVDTLGDGPRCWTSTFGGIVPQNPLWVGNQPCYIDDDSAPGPNGNIPVGERGTFLSEFWDTNFGFTF